MIVDPVRNTGPVSNPENTMTPDRVTLCILPLIALWLLLSPLAFGQQPQDGAVRVATVPTLEGLMADEDTDGDTNITIDDPRVPGTSRGDRRFTLRAADHRPFEIAGTYYLSNLLAELAVARASGKDSIDLRYADLFEPPVDRISRSIRERYWQGLRRTIDEQGLAQVFRDDKSPTVDGLHYVYVPYADTVAQGYFRGVMRRHPDWKMQVVTLPASITPEYVRGLDGRHGLLTLGLEGDSSGAPEGAPFVVPGGRFNEMYGWDSYFIVLGLLQDGYVSLAKSIVDNLVYEIRHYGKILNANRTYYLTRSQPPFLTSMALAVYERLPRETSTSRWLHGVVEAAIREYEDVWMGKDHLTEIGLSRYFDTGMGPPPEVEAGRFDSVFARTARDHGMPPDTYQEEYVRGRQHSTSLDRFFRNDRAMRESGHDASYRLLDACADLVTVDLNSLLYKTESDIATIIAREFQGALTAAGKIERADAWRARAANRRDLVTRFLWNEARGMFFDYNVVTKRQTAFVSATAFFPVWAGLATDTQASRLVTNALPLLAMPGGIAGSTEESRGPISDARPQTQWDYPFGWAPHQMLVWSGLQRYHFDDLARDLAYRWLYMITMNACNYNGTIAEKYDVVTRSALVFAEYGNVGTKFSYITREGFGWTNASILVARNLLSPRQLEDLNRLVPPEWHQVQWGKAE
jgi:alpha,alpha-trehalase